MNEIKSLTTAQIAQLNAPIPDWALKQHPSRTYLTVIHPMAVIDRLNEVFGAGKWKTICHDMPFNGKFAVTRLELIIPEYDIHLEQYGGNDNSDAGDALKGAATDALTKCASYLGIGAYIYKGHGDTQKSVKTATTNNNDFTI